MTQLTKSACVPCRGGVPTLADAEIAALLPDVPGWRVEEEDGIKRLVREFKLADFVQAMALAGKIGDLAEVEGHHPDLHVGWGRLKVEIWTHKIRGLHRNDFILAAKVNELPVPPPA
jgi:4a-hydroxytetrahydrobiopterin dehydratase